MPSVKLSQVESIAGPIGYKTHFIPFSMSRHADGRWKCLNWKCQLTINGKAYTCDYSQGVGHLPKMPSGYPDTLTKYEADAIEFGKAGYKTVPAPSVVDILHSLLQDSQSADQTFENWCSELGYDSDSRKAESTYNECRKILRWLQSCLTAEELEQFGKLFQDY